jgi:hypothetical protein
MPKRVDDYRRELYEYGKLRRQAKQLGPEGLARARAELTELFGEVECGGTGGGSSTEAGEPWSHAAGA